jgi:hypothetical protein
MSMSLCTPGLALICLLAAAPAGAQPAAPKPAPTAKPAAADPAIDEARKHFRQGMLMSEDHDYNGAVAEFEAAYRLSREPVALYQMGLTLRALHRYPEAIETMERYLAHMAMDPRLTPEHRRTVEDTIKEMRSLVAEITVALQPATAALIIDGRAAKLGDGKTLLAAGDHTLEATAEDFQPLRQEVRVVAGVPQTIALKLVPVPRFGKVVVTTDRGGARLRVDGKDAGEAPKELELLAGGHQLDATVPGWRPWHSEITVTASQTRNVDITFEPLPESPVYKKWWFWTGAAVVAAVAGGVALAAAGGKTEGPLRGTLNPGAQPAQ